MILDLGGNIHLHPTSLRQLPESEFKAKHLPWLTVLSLHLQCENVYATLTIVRQLIPKAVTE